MKEKLIIHCDEYNWTLVAQRVVTKKGSKNMGGTYDYTLGYFPNLASLAKYAAERQLRVHGLENYEEARDELLKVLNETIKEINTHECKCKNTMKSCISNSENPKLTKMKRGRKKTKTT